MGQLHTLSTSIYSRMPLYSYQFHFGSIPLPVPIWQIQVYRNSLPNNLEKSWCFDRHPFTTKKTVVDSIWFFHQKLNGTESQRTPKRRLLELIKYPRFFRGAFSGSCWRFLGDGYLVIFVISYLPHTILRPFNKNRNTSSWTLLWKTTSNVGEKSWWVWMPQFWTLDVGRTTCWLYEYKRTILSSWWLFLLTSLKHMLLSHVVPRNGRVVQGCCLLRFSYRSNSATNLEQKS